MRLVARVTVFLTFGTIIDAKTTQPTSMDCAEGRAANLPCNHSTISGNEYIHWYRQIHSQGPQRQKVQHLDPAPRYAERHCCVLLHRERRTLGQMGLHLCNISLVASEEEEDSIHLEQNVDRSQKVTRKGEKEGNERRKKIE
ncbi:hypothetical protein P7K49_017796 [Saguinus oedipus]|uniref:Uncharacterized protein n=1 Tax=Saguinus oedipus TaxID=9490 RepID=A0ABQ9V3S5_SAGOE|nr:hypothetical protein P7K49_017796 [Saguinus oedipus]